MPIDPARTCPECGAKLPAGTEPGECPNCLLGLGLAVADAMAEGPASASVEPKIQTTDQPQTDDASPGAGHPPIPDFFGDYELLGEIGRGGMGVVYKARQQSLDRVVALKLLLSGSHAPPEAVKRFHAEAVATAALQHPNIVAIHEVGVHQGQHFLVMDFVAGSSLAKVIGNRPLAARRAAGYVKTVAAAIHYAHEQGLLHRDLKPSNILVDADDQPRVTDFGLARRFQGDSELTVSGQVLGSPNYMPPEQATGKRGTASRRSDVYALGAILYHALTGRAPFVGEGPADTLQSVLNVEPISPRALNPSVPADLETVCLKCLEKETAKRYATAQMLAEELGRFLEGKPVLARPMGRLVKAWRWCRRNPRLAAATGAVVLSLMMGLAGVSWQWRQTESQRVRAGSEAVLARRNAYAADMKGVQWALEENELSAAQELLNRHRPAGKSEIDLRSWEWRYLWARCQSDECFTLCQYSNAVSALAFSPEGKYLAVRRAGGTVALWDMVAKKSVAEWPGSAGNESLAFALGGTLLAWGNVDARGRTSVRLVEIGTRKELAPLLHPTGILSVAFSPDALKLATLDFAGTVRIWNLASQAVQRVITNLEAAAYDFPSDRLSGAARRTSFAPGAAAADLWEPRSPPASLAIRFQGAMRSYHFGRVLFSPDSRFLAVGGSSPLIQLSDWRTGKRKSSIPLNAPPTEITAMAFSPDSRLLAASCGFGGANLYIWDVGMRRGVRLAGHRGWVMALAFSPNGKRLASASTDQTLRLWDVERQIEVGRWRGNTDEVWAIAWSPDGRNLVTGAKDGTVRFWDPDAKPPLPYATVPAEVWSWGLAFLPDSKTLLTVTPPGGEVVAWEWEAPTLKKLEHLTFLGSNHSCAGFSSDGRWLAVGGTNGNIQVWDFRARRRVANLVFPDGAIIVVCFTPNGHYLHSAAWTPDRRAVNKVWETGAWGEVRLQGIDYNKLRDFCFAPDETMVAVGHDNGTADWWDVATCKRLNLYEGPKADLVRVRFSPDGRYFAMLGTYEGWLLLRDAATRASRPIGRGYRGELHCLVFSTDSRRLITTGTSPTAVVKVWDVETGRDVATLPGEPGLFFHNLGFSPDGNTLFAVSAEGAALLWHAPSWDAIEAKEKTRRAP